MAGVAQTRSVGRMTFPPPFRYPDFRVKWEHLQGSRPSRQTAAASGSTERIASEMGQPNTHFGVEVGQSGGAEGQS